MEAFEAFVAVALEADDFVVSPAVKFPVVIETKRGSQEHGFEVDLVGAKMGAVSSLPRSSHSSDPGELPPST